jgi:2'-5' RNA ligase
VSDDVRAFVALELPEAAREAIGALQARLRPRLGRIRLVRPEGAHLTLRFLGETSPVRLASMREALGKTASLCPPFEARLGGLGTFPERGSPRILWLAVEVPDAVSSLQAACERAAVAAGFPPEGRPFRPHLTLGRWRERAERPDLPEGTDLGLARVDALVIFRSELRPEGARYTALARFPLEEAALVD